MSDSNLGSLLGNEVSEVVARALEGAGGQWIARARFRGIDLVAAGADEASARAALHAKVEKRADLLRSAPLISNVSEVNLVVEPGLESTVERRVVQPMDRTRAAIELELGEESAMVFVDTQTGAPAVVMRGAGGVIRTLGLGEPVHGADYHQRPLIDPDRVGAAPDQREAAPNKARAIRDLLRCPRSGGPLEERALGLYSPMIDHLYPFVDGRPLLTVSDDWDGVAEGQPKSQNTYGQQVLALIEQFCDGWVLDCGSGSPSRGFPNVVHLDVFAFDEVDVVTDGRNLPFPDDTFDAVLSEAVLEHVPDPEQYTREVARVMKPGALVRLDAPFLFPYHGFPDHYFNFSKSGLRELLGRCGLEPVSIEVEPHQHPQVALANILSRYGEGMPADQREVFERMTISEVLGKLGQGGGAPFDRIDPTTTEMLAAGFGVLARKSD